MMHPIWDFIPKRMVVSDKTHAVVFNHRKQALCGTGMPKQGRGYYALLPFIVDQIDCGKCRTILSCDPHSARMVARYLSMRHEHVELPKNKWNMHPSCYPKDERAKIIRGYTDCFTITFKCNRDPKVKHCVATRCDWKDERYSWW